MRAFVLWIGLLFAAAGEHPDFTGVWQLDLAASDTPDALLDLAGVSWVERKVAAVMSSTHTIQQSDATMVIDIASFLETRREIVPLDGTPTTSPNLDGEPVVSTTNWQGSSLVTQTTFKLEDGRRVPLTIDRSLGSDGTMILVLQVHVSESQTVSMRRVFQRKA